MCCWIPHLERPCIETSHNVVPVVQKLDDTAVDDTAGISTTPPPLPVPNCFFPLNVQSEIQLLSRVFCYSWLVCLLGFWLTNSKNSGERSEPSGGLGREGAVEPGDTPLIAPRRRSNSIPWCIFPEAFRNIAVMADSIVKWGRFLVSFFLISVPVKVRKLHYFVIWHDFSDWQWLKSEVSI